jgi:hypothetical protein
MRPGICLPYALSSFSSSVTSSLSAALSIAFSSASSSSPPSATIPSASCCPARTASRARSILAAFRSFLRSAVSSSGVKTRIARRGQQLIALYYVALLTLSHTLDSPFPPRSRSRLTRIALTCLLCQVGSLLLSVPFPKKPDSHRYRMELDC